ncbi:CRISPR-associated Csy4 family protein [Bisgaardia hudsonensis]|uniref:CRISPR-associated Csy4 family protein n=1 Tax=Bisgaardia hudsonensis TaxID=109472 RepID=A0A4R2MRI8_9PAST|nr:type I-F CRISPR-associated endoribonuclease Cas6/Csy4 [Bisgaardia hudsonensis]TCP11459.1 CRISPR-associated Csy4 family protein [Bisgaardia hudsonensis]
MDHQSHYIELKAIPQVDMLQSEVVSYAMQILHKYLPHFDGRIGISFPAYGLGRTLGGIIRLFGNQEDIQVLQNALMQSDLENYVLISDAIKTPEIIEYRCYSRFQRKGQSAIRRAKKRLTEQHKWSEQVEQNMLNKQEQQDFLPHIHLKSATTKQNFILSVKVTVKHKAYIGEFSTYGLSSEATVPHF